MTDDGYRFFTGLGSNKRKFQNIGGSLVTENLPISAPKVQTLRTLSPGDARIEKARHAAIQLEATFLAEMLKSAGFGEQQNSFSGGTGEDHFASFHRQAIAEKIAARGGIGLAEHFLNAMLETENDT